MIKFQQSQALTSHFESFWSIVQPFFIFRWPLVLDCGHVSTSDFTAAKGFKAMISDFRKREQPIIFYNTSPSVVDTFLGVNIEEFVVVNSNEELLSHLRSEF